MKKVNIFENPEFYRKIILSYNNLLKYDIDKCKGKSLICVFFTSYCGVGCPFCFFHSPSLKKEKSISEELENHFSTEGVEKFISFANEANVGYLQISGGGEPFLEKNAIIECLKRVEADRIILVTSGSWAFDKMKAEEYLDDLYDAFNKRKSKARVTIRLSVSDYHNIKLKGKPVVNLIKIFEDKYKNDKNFTLQLKTFENDNSLVHLLNEYFSGFKLDIVEDNGSDDFNHIKIMPWKYVLTLKSGFKIIVGKSRIFNSNLRPNLYDKEEIRKSEKIYDTDLELSQKNNSSIVYNSNGINGIDWIVEYNGNVCTWQNRVQDNLLNIYEDNYNDVLRNTYSDPLTYSYIDKGAKYREKIVSEVSPKTVSLMKSVNIRDYAGTQLFFDEKIRLYYTIRVIQDYLLEGKINIDVLNEFPKELIDAIKSNLEELKCNYFKSNYSILEQELSNPVNVLEFHDFLELVKLGHFEISDYKVKEAIKYYNFISNSDINSIDEIKCSSGLEIERRLTKRMMERKKIKSEEVPIYYYLCRHGETNWNVEKRIKGQLETIDTAFTERGIKQIGTLATFIKSNNIQAIFSSDLCRTVETSRIVNNKVNVPLYFYNKFRGLNMGDFQGKSIDCFLNDDYVKECFKDYSLVIPGGESINQLISRFKDGMDIIRNKYNYDRVAIISHGAAISNIKSEISGDKYEDIDYCILKYYNNNYEIVEYGNYE